MASTDPLVFQSSKVYAWIQVGEVRTDINDTATTLEIQPSIVTSETDTVGHRIVNGMDILIDSEIMKVSDVSSSTDNSITVTRAELANDKIHDTAFGRGGDAASHTDGTAIYAWSELNDNNGNSLTQQLSLEKTLYQPDSLQLVLSNPSRANVLTDVGILDNVIKEGTPIKVINGANFIAMFRGRVHSLTRQYDNAAGTTLQLTAYDALYELGRSAITGDGAEIDFDVDSSAQSDGYTEDASDRKISSVIKLLAQRYQFGGTDGTESVLTMIEPIASNAEPRFQPSHVAKESSARNGRISFASTKDRVLHTMQRLALTDKSPAGNTLGYYFHTDPNQYNFSTGLKPTPVLNYYPIGFQPSADSGNTSTAGRLLFNNFSSTIPDENGTRKRMISNVSFDEFDTENVNVINVRYKDPISGFMREIEMEAFYVGTGGAFSDLHFSAAYLPNSAASLRLVATREDVAGLNGSHDPDLKSVSDQANFRSRVVDASNNIIGYVQYAGFSSNSAGLLVLSGTSTSRSGSDVAAGETIYLDNKDSGNTKVLSSVTDPNAPNSFRPQAAGEKRVAITMEFGNDVNFQHIREAVAARFLQQSRPKLRGRFQTLGQFPSESFQLQIPSSGDTITETTVGSRTYVEYTDANISSGLTDTGNNFTAIGYVFTGMRAGMPIMKLDGDGGNVSTHGYLNFVRNGNDNSNPSLGFMLESGSIAANDYLRFAIPLTPGHMIQMTSLVHGVAVGGGDLKGGRGLVTSMMYQETASEAFTDIETVSYNDDSEDVIAARMPDYSNIDDDTDDDYGGSYEFTPYKPHFTGEIFAGQTDDDTSTGNTVSGTNDDTVTYGTGTLYVGTETYRIDGTAGTKHSRNGTYGIGAGMATNDSDNDGMSDVSYIMFFEPALSKTRFYVKTESEFQQRNSEEGSNTTSGNNKHSPIGLNRLKIAKITPNATSSDVTIEYFISVGAATTGENSNTADTKGFPASVIGGRALTGNINKSWVPTSDGAHDLGLSSSAFRWQNVYATSGSVNSSDERMKEEIKGLDLGLEFVKDLNPVSYKWKKKQPNKIDKTHFGIIAQDLVKVFDKYNIKGLEDFGALYRDPYVDKAHPENNHEGYYGLSYTELIAPLIKAIQELSDKVDKLENEGKE
ncbi:MAG TPA: hypothetical protein DCM40_17710 [Maribacter sp.]|nr:hypothetical protein [Maribacter sp.]